MSKTDKIKILYLDDEVNNLIGFKASFRVDYTILVANNSTEAYQHLEKNPDIRIIFCDQRMPDKTGVEFFEEARSLYPLPIRILLTGYTDIESVIDSINRGNIFRYVKKPWTNEDILSCIDQANKFYMVNSMLSLKNIELQKAYNELEKFAYSVTHDIRGPLLSILGAADVAQYIDDIEEIKEMLRLMEKSVKKLDTFILNIHDYYSLKQGELQIKEVNFEDVVKDQTDNYKMTTNMKNINFIAHVEQNETFRTDEMSLKIILSNLLSNAFKYQKKHNRNKLVELAIQVRRGIATLQIKDNGIGIQEKHIDDIFNMFYRATAEEVGSGIGLYNVKDAVAKIGGEIKVTSVFDEGTTFLITIPTK
ncbi:hybrid sensor histidine kinase/response regulator [Mucilaginibacter arboris]|uniref:histidine kinase n=1 Tax=Mucilaginibacter arboris TaxID=2682090 RepID=A0A7K1SV75_9SPHI|nr:hybrid sensor histidine kinase/response regulator [Mucilaginibacter arboris]MVN21242.1 response regulator [Mucilaginibacter arboris]